MSEKVKEKFFNQIGSIAATAMLGVVIALCQSFLQVHGVSCDVAADPALAGASGALLRTAQIAIFTGFGRLT